jgi:predicted nucleotidyltransferase
MEIKNIGSLHSIDINGYILNPSKYPVVQEEYTAVVDYILTHCCLSLGDSLHSVYLRGSVAKGQAIPFISDVDTLVIMHHSITEGEKARLFTIKETITETFPFVTKVEVMAVGVEQTEKTWLKFLLKTQCVCIYGMDLIPAIEPFKVGKEAYSHSLHIVQQMTDLQQELEEINEPEEIKGACTWIMTAIVRAGFELVMERDRSYTRDLYPNYERFSAYFPEKEAEMRRILSLAIEPTDDKETINEVINAIRPFMIEQTLSFLSN